MDCASCGAPNPDDAKFCESCGAPQTAAPTTDTAATAETAEIPVAASPVAPSATPSQATTAAPGGKTPRKSNTMWWIAGGCLVLMTIGLLLAGCLGAYFWYRAQQPKPLKKQPSASTRNTPSTSVTPAKGYSTPEEAVRARAGSTMVLDVRNQTDDTAEVWVGPPNSEFMGIYDVKKGADGSWTVTGQRDIPALGEGDEGGGSGGGASSGGSKGTSYQTGPLPNPDRTAYPSVGHANAAWMAVGNMFGALKTGDVAGARKFCTADFYSTYKDDLFDQDFLKRFHDFEVRGYSDGDGWNPRIWVRLYYDNGLAQNIIVDTTIVTGGKFGAYAAAAKFWAPRK